MSDFLKAARYTPLKGPLPHQSAAWNWAWSLLNKDQQAEFLEMFRADPAVKEPLLADPHWLAVALTSVKKHEGLRLTSYRDSGGVWTIGYGLTELDGAPVKAGQQITEKEADALLKERLQRDHDQLLALLPEVRALGANQTAALLSWAFNVGMGAVSRSTLRKRLNEGEAAIKVIPEELPRWNKVNGKASKGLTARRAAEVKLFAGGAPTGTTPPPPAQKAESGFVLKVPYQSQRDNASGQGDRECFSSSAAMVAMFYGKVQSDDEYNRIRSKYGDTTHSRSHIQALGHLGLHAKFLKSGTLESLIAEIDAGRPLMVGWLHKGHHSKPLGGGHWSVVIGYTPRTIIHNDPFGKCHMTNGGYFSGHSGKAAVYSKEQWLERWMVEGPGSGWMMPVYLP